VPDKKQILPTEAPWLSKEEIDNGYRLSCQLKVKEDINIFIPEEFFSIKNLKPK